MPYYCNGQCDYIFHISGRRMDCRFVETTTESKAPKVSIGSDNYEMVPICPQPASRGTCADLCFHCEDKGQLCCSNGCGTVCKYPLMVPALKNDSLPTTTDLPIVAILQQRQFQQRRISSGSCPKPPPVCIPETYDCHKVCPSRNQLCCWNGCGGFTCMDPEY